MVDAVLKAGETTKYNFYIISGMNPANKSTEQTAMGIPSTTNPFVMDGKCQERRVTFDVYMLPRAWTGSSKGGDGAILTQKEDLDYLHRNQASILAAAGVSTWTLAVAWPVAMDHVPEDPLNEGGVTSGSTTQNHYGIISSVAFPRNAGELYMVATIEFLEAAEVYGL